MPSISSSKLIRERTIEFCRKINDWEINTSDDVLFTKIREFLQKEYKIIPEKERIGKGAVYISRYIAKAMINYLKIEIKVETDYFIEFTEKAFNFGEKTENIKFLHLTLYLFAEFIFHYPEKFDNVKLMIEKWANHNEWQIRESVGEAILSGLKKNPEEILNYLSELAINERENSRKLVSESLRPRADVKWLRNPNKNDKILEILTILRKDSSIYVRKSVGNNIKDLSKYMPEKMLDLMETWIQQARIKTHDTLSTEIGLNREEINLIWTIKHAMRWLKQKKPEFHDRIRSILGKNYILYFDEKRNRLAKPK